MVVVMVVALGDSAWSAPVCLPRNVARQRCSHGQLPVGGGPHGVAMGVLGGRDSRPPVDTLLDLLRAQLPMQSPAHVPPGAGAAGAEPGRQAQGEPVTGGWSIWGEILVALTHTHTHTHTHTPCMVLAYLTSALQLIFSPSFPAQRAVESPAALLEVLPGHLGGVCLLVGFQPNHQSGSLFPQVTGAVCLVSCCTQQSVWCYKMF